ncbi:MAG TPA: hypothetical protein VFT46_02930 [Holophagaceae bacterium]|nr:hypothetical protein [Holophagaceae bacterium]
MIPRAYLSAGLFPVLLQAQAPAGRPAVKVLLHAAPPAEGGATLDLGQLESALGRFTADQHLPSPAPDGDGWVLQIELNSSRTPYGSLDSTGHLSLMNLKAGRASAAPPGSSDLRILALDTAHLNGALADALVRESFKLLVSARVLSADPMPDLETIHKPFLEPGGQVMDLPFSQVGVREKPTLPKAQPLGTYRFEVMADEDGRPESVRLAQAPSPMAERVGTWLLAWQFSPVQQAGHPMRTRFPIRLTFRVY